MNSIGITTLLWIAAITGQLRAEEAMMLDHFDSNTEGLKWTTVNDGVMGGLSKGDSYLKAPSSLQFKGAISLDNNGGFSSIRTYGDSRDLSQYDGFELRLKGDGRKYYLTSRCNGGQMLAYWSPIQPEKGKWVTVKVPFKSFYATSFGRKIPGLKLNTQKVTSVGFMLYDKKAGDFSLEVDWIKAYKK